MLDFQFTGVVNNAKVSAIRVDPGVTGTPTSVPNTSPTTHRVNAGGSSYTDSQSQVWSADLGYNGGSTSSTGAAIEGTVDDPLYRSERWGNFTYRLPVANGTYTVTLKFAEIYFTASPRQTGRRVFNAAIEGQPVLTNFDILAEAPPLTALDKTFTATVTDGVLDVQFTNVVNNAKLSAIQVRPAP
jgi:hypothetical protein